MLIIKSIGGLHIRVTNERWAHIIKRHPEMNNQKEKVLETISNPDLIQKGDSGELLAIRYYKETPLTSKFLVVAYKEINNIDGFLITGYFTNEPSGRRKKVWKR